MRWAKLPDCWNKGGQYLLLNNVFISAGVVLDG